MLHYYSRFFLIIFLFLELLQISTCGPVRASSSHKGKEPMDAVVKEEVEEEYDSDFLAEVDRIENEYISTKNKRKEPMDAIVKEEVKEEEEEEYSADFWAEVDRIESEYITRKKAKFDDEQTNAAGNYHNFHRGTTSPSQQPWNEKQQPKWKSSFPSTSTNQYQPNDLRRWFKKDHAAGSTNHTADSTLQTPMVYINVQTEPDPNGQQRTGLGIFWGPGLEENAGVSFLGGEHFNRAYYSAVLVALGRAMELQLHSLNVKVGNNWIALALGEWIHYWAKSGWRGKGKGKKIVGNVDLVRKLHAEMKKLHSVDVKHVTEATLDMRKARQLATESIRNAGGVVGNQQVINALRQQFDGEHGQL